MLRTTRNIRFSESRQLYERSDPSPHTRTTYLEKWSCKTNTLRMTGSSFRGTVSSIEVKSTCSNSPGPLQVRGCMGAIGGAASNLRQRPHFLIRLRRSRAMPGHQNRSCIREADRRWPWCAASRWQPSIAALRCL